MQSLKRFYSKHLGSVKVTLDPSSFETHNIPAPSLETTFTAEQAIKYYTEMTRIRRLEMACDSAYKSKLIRGFCHLSTGQEAVAAGNLY